MDIIKMAREMGKAIQQDENYLALMKAKDVIDNDEVLQKQISEFNLKKMDLNQELGKEDKDQDKLTSLDREIKELYQSIIGNEQMIAFNEAKQAIDTMMNQVSQILMLSVNGQDPDTELSSCSGSCSSCSGCH
ncbi:YlbF family regulator [Zongyangia hominis]|uniref:YlbF family regulator n=1 Tax=Zongyangia hominis TaxID=2763677 RepID=A0A926IAW5_9FIRM|nr:YlbF family regulator [Zongyangia hominis]MBC8569643.1 YlbF family regulator [Zongyangia hominis]